MIYNSNFDFWSTKIKVYSNNYEIIDQINFIYKFYVLNKPLKTDELDYVIKITSNDIKNLLIFGENIENGSLNIYVGDNENHLSPWKKNITILPPISLIPLVNQYTFIHGCAIYFKDFIHVFIGPSRSGKTTFILRMLDKGAKLISDDILVIENSSGRVIPFKKAIAVRNTNEFYYMNKIINLKERSPSSVRSIYIPRLNLDSFLINPEDIEGWNYFKSQKTPDYIYLVGNKFKKIDNFKNFVEYTLNQRTMNNGNYLEIIAKIYNSLKQPPLMINIRDTNKMFEILSNNN